MTKNNTKISVPFIKSLVKIIAAFLMLFLLAALVQMIYLYRVNQARKHNGMPPIHELN
jgi:hypothetical protein